MTTEHEAEKGDLIEEWLATDLLFNGLFPGVTRPIGHFMPFDEVDGNFGDEQVFDPDNVFHYGRHNGVSYALYEQTTYILWAAIRKGYIKVLGILPDNGGIVAVPPELYKDQDRNHRQVRLTQDPNYTPDVKYSRRQIADFISSETFVFEYAQFYEIGYAFTLLELAGEIAAHNEQFQSTILDDILSDIWRADITDVFIALSHPFSLSGGGFFSIRGWKRTNRDDLRAYVALEDRYSHRLGSPKNGWGFERLAQHGWNKFAPEVRARALEPLVLSPETACELCSRHSWRMPECLTDELYIDVVEGAGAGTPPQRAIFRESLDTVARRIVAELQQRGHRLSVREMGRFARQLCGVPRDRAEEALTKPAFPIWTGVFRPPSV